MDSHKNAIFKEAFSYTTPIILTYILMGGVFGVMMANAGHSAWISLLMSIIIYAGAMQFVAVSLLLLDISLFNVAAISLSINARQFFYAIASLRRYRIGGWKKWYLVFSVTDETFAILNLREQKLKQQSSQDFHTYQSNQNSIIMQQLESSNQQVMFLISLLNQIYWIIGCVGGTLLGSSLSFIHHIQGLEFIVIATFSVLLYENLKYKENWIPICIGIFCTLLCFFVDREHFLSYALVLIVCILCVTQKYIHKSE
ncbi:azaleucine resistance protein AzlC [Helicobacter didelphidarum]|uniref:Azaleucine resistance protein AzlC n=1 Tax=Helicobacter didelphidarum TaxID=2040648 RepID=A0A3D8IFA8_9HELI|nr:AzlC family ABC transporter permease [Helicobacter didelphidarum]RDU63576.1 azaleucine resistance protein AzlC [Helicobacter didelphidarum]